jgi:thymidylate kinase
VYQGVEQYLGADYVYELHKQNELLNPYPDMVILVDADAETCFKRMEIRDQGKQHNYNRCSLDELKRRRGTYLDMAKKFVPEEKLWILDNNRPMQEVQAEIEERLIKLFNL